MSVGMPIADLVQLPSDVPAPAVLPAGNYRARRPRCLLFHLSCFARWDLDYGIYAYATFAARGPERRGALGDRTLAALTPCF